MVRDVVRLPLGFPFQTCTPPLMTPHIFMTPHLSELSPVPGGTVGAAGPSLGARVVAVVESGLLASAVSGWLWAPTQTRENELLPKLE